MKECNKGIIIIFIATIVLIGGIFYANFVFRSPATLPPTNSAPTNVPAFVPSNVPTSLPTNEPASSITFTPASAADNLHLTSPKPGEKISSPLTVTGEARYWYFEASFPVRLYDADGNLLAQTPAQAQGDWMTTDFVPFSATLTFGEVKTQTGTLVLHNDNPSDLRPLDQEARVPVFFETANTLAKQSECLSTGCSGQICADHEVITTCEYLPEYSCYQKAKCERQQSGECAWTESAELMSCLTKARQ